MKRISATEAKNNFGGLLEAVSASGAVEIVKHGRPVAVVLSPSALEAMSRPPRSSPEATWSQTHMIPPAQARAAQMVRNPVDFDE